MGRLLPHFTTPQVSATHRLEDNKEEVARCQAAGCEIAPSTVEGKPAGPIRCVPAERAVG